MFDRPSKYQSFTSYSLLSIENYLSYLAKLSKKDVRGDKDLMRSKEQIEAAARLYAKDRHDRVQDKRKARRSTTDLASLFEAAWGKGQRERSTAVPPARLIPRDRKALKDQVINPSLETELDVEDFAYWTALHWDAIGGTYFAKAKSYPGYPAFRYLVAALPTFLLAYQNKEYLDEDTVGVSSPALRRKAAAVDAVKVDAVELDKLRNETIADLKAQLREEQKQTAKLRAQQGLPVDDDPVYARIAAVASKQITIGKWDDDEPKPRRLTLKRKRP
jgi:hypothetical protein